MPARPLGTGRRITIVRGVTDIWRNTVGRRMLTLLMITITAGATACGAPASPPPSEPAVPATPAPAPPPQPRRPATGAAAATGRACLLISNDQAVAVLGGEVDLSQDNDSTCIYRRHGRGAGPLLNLTVSSRPVSTAEFASTTRTVGKTVPVTGLGDQAFTTADGTSISVLKGDTQLDTALVLATTGTAKLLEMTRAAVARL